LDADLLKSKEKLSKFELKSLSSTRGTPNVFNSPQLDNFFNVPSTSSALLAETKVSIQCSILIYPSWQKVRRWH